MSHVAAGAARFIMRSFGLEHGEVRRAIILGSGLAPVADVSGARRLEYSSIPGAVETAVPGHAGELVCGSLAGDTAPTLIFSGRVHAYEGISGNCVVQPARIAAALGCRELLLCNAAGGIASALEPGSIMLVADQLNISFRNPLIGPVHGGEARFPEMSSPFDESLRGQLRAAARSEQVVLHEGVYAGVLGPSYETAAEIRMLALLGADAVGMSLVQEVIAARAARLSCGALCVITNRAAGLSARALSHEDVLRVSSEAARRVARLLRYAK